MSKIEVNTIEPQCGTTLTVGASGDTITFPTGTTIVNNGTQTGFGRTGTVDWITTPKTATFSAVSGEGYFCNTTAGAFTVNLPAGSAGAIVSVADYAGTWQTNNVTVTPNGTEKIGGIDANATLNTEGQSVTFVYVDSTQGWINTMDSTSNVRAASFITATGGTPSQDGDYEIRTFTGPGTFCVSALSNNPANNVIDWTIIAGGGGGGGELGGGGGAGGYRESPGTSTGSYSASPLAGGSSVTATITSYPIAVGAGGPGSTSSPIIKGTPGVNSVALGITSAGGGGGGTNNSSPSGSTMPGIAGGSGGGGAGSGENNGGGGAGNTPPVSPSQGFAGGTGYYGAPSPGIGAAGGGGATAVGGDGSAPASGAGGAGASTSITGSSVQRSGGGGGGSYLGTGGSGGAGGGGAGGDSNTSPGTNGTDNTGGGGGGARSTAGNGGSGVVIIRYKFQ